MMVRRHVPFGTDVFWDVWVRGPRDSGYAEYDLAGRLKQVHH